MNSSSCDCKEIFTWVVITTFVNNDCCQEGAVLLFFVSQDLAQ